MDEAARGVNGSESVLVILAVLAFGAGALCGVMLAVSRRRENRTGHQPRHRA